MATQPTDVSDTAAEHRPLRIWPALLMLGLVGVAQATPYLVEEFSFGIFMFAFTAPLVAGLGILLWWMFAARATARERWLGPLAVVLVAVLSYLPLDQSIKGMGFVFFAVPAGVAAVGLALVLLSRVRPSIRVAGTVLAALLGFASWNAARSDGVWGDFKTSLHWRWQPTAEDRFLADLQRSGAATSQAAQADASSETIEDAAWPGFRGPNRDSSVPGVVLETDWQAYPPKELWRRKVGPGWSSFAVAGRLLFTQEQRGSVEVVACYDADTGAERWIHDSPARFWEAVAGAGPRATPTLAGGRLFAAGATGLVHCLNPATGAVIWQRDLTKDAAREPLTWGFASSPLIIDDLVIVYAGGADDKGVFAYDARSGEPRWSVAAGDHSYSSPHRATIAGRDCVLMLTNTGLSAIDPAEGKNSWTYEWKFDAYRCVQPLVVQPSGVLLGTGAGAGTRRVEVALGDEAPRVEDRWTSLDMKPDFNDYVAHKGCLYGFDHNIFACIDLETGKRHWKKGRYGNGQVLLLPDADQLLALTEKGEVVVIRATPEKLEELARKKVLNDKTWNHPVLVGSRLYVRNGEEAVCLELPLAATGAVAAREESR